jgi:hypothetical protein
MLLDIIKLLYKQRMTAVVELPGARFFGTYSMRAVPREMKALPMSRGISLL